MLRLITLVVVGLAMLGGFMFLAVQPGDIIYTDGVTKTTISPAFAAAITLVVTVVMVALWGFIAWLWGLPARLRRAKQENARKKCLDALGQSLAAFDSGEISEARRQAQKALGFAPDVPGTKLLAARAAVVAGDGSAGERLYGELTDVAGYNVAARRGLAELALSRGNLAAAISHAETALQSSKKAPWPAEFLFSQRVLAADWDGALGALDDAERRGLLGHKTAMRRRSVVLTAAAHRAERMMEPAAALELAQRAVKFAPGFAPAAVMAARLLTINSKQWQAAGTLETAWEASPHPALAIAYRDLKVDEDSATQTRWLDGLIRLNPAHRESKILAVEQALLAQDNVAAIQGLEPLLAERPTSRILGLRAAAAKAAGDEDGAREWMAKGVNAPREPDWSDLDPDGPAFAYEDADWVRLIESYGDRGVLVHPRLERSDGERLAAPHLASLTQGVSTGLQSGQMTVSPLVPDDPGIGDGLDMDDDDAREARTKKSWLNF
jgi:HemY protein